MSVARCCDNDLKLRVSPKVIISRSLTEETYGKTFFLSLYSLKKGKFDQQMVEIRCSKKNNLTVDIFFTELSQFWEIRINEMLMSKCIHPFAYSTFRK